MAEADKRAGMLHLHPLARRTMDEAVLVTGAARSGTTIMGSLLYSLQTTEYEFEPPFLFSLLPQIDQIPGDRWRFLFESYMFEDVFMNALAGRRINTNRADASSIYRSKPESLVSARLERSRSRPDLLREADERRLVYKIPDVLPYLLRLRDHYPDQLFVVMFRSLSGTVGSLLNKGWFTDSGLGGFEALWPGRIPENQTIVPHWVRPDDDGRWLEMSHEDRCLYYYRRMYGSLLELKRRNLVLVDYDSFVEETEREFRELASRLGLDFGPRTGALLEDTYRRSEHSMESLSEADRTLLREAEEVEERVRARFFRG